LSTEAEVLDALRGELGEASTGASSSAIRATLN
jgi:hypothetical protein